MLSDEERNKIIKEHMYGHLSDMCREIERAVLAKASQQVQGDREKLLNLLLEGVEVDSGASIQEKFDALQRHWYLTAREALAMPEPKQEPVGTNRYGLYMGYMVGKLNILIRDIDCYKGDEAARTLLRLAKVADESVFSEPEFSPPQEAPKQSLNIDDVVNRAADFVQCQIPISEKNATMAMAIRAALKYSNYFDDLKSTPQKAEDMPDGYVHVDEVIQLCKDFSGRNGSIYISDVQAALSGLSAAPKPEGE